MLKRLLLPLLLLTLALTGCAEKKPVSAQLAIADLPFTANFPPEWKAIPKSKAPKSILEKAKANGIILLSAYTSAPTADFRFPTLYTYEVNTGKMSEPEILMSSNANIGYIEGQFRSQGLPITFNEKEYDGQQKRLYIDFNSDYRANQQIRIFSATFFTEKGMLIFNGMTATGDAKGITDIRQIMDSITLDPELQYR